MDDATSVNLLQRVLDIIVYHQKITNAKNDDNGSCSSSIIELYPLSDQPNIQFVPKQIYKKHIHGLLFALKILYRYGESFRIANAKVHDCYNRHFQNQPYSLEITKRRTKCDESRVQTLQLKIKNQQCPDPTPASTAITVAQSYDHQLLTYLDAENMKIREVRGNQHMTKGIGSDRQLISVESMRKRDELDGDAYKILPRSQPTKQKASLFIRQAFADPYPMKEIFDEMKRIAKTKMKVKSSCDNRKQIELDKLRVTTDLNNERKSGTRRGKYRDADTLEPIELEKPASETNIMQVKNFKNKAQMTYIVEEIVFRLYKSYSQEDTDKREEKRRELSIIDKVMDLKSKLVEVLDVPRDDLKSNSIGDFAFEIISPKCLDLGVNNLINWSADKEKERQRQG